MPVQLAVSVARNPIRSAACQLHARRQLPGVWKSYPCKHMACSSGGVRSEFLLASWMCIGGAGNTATRGVHCKLVCPCSAHRVSQRTQPRADSVLGVPG